MSCSSSSSINCSSIERAALIAFKQSLKDPSSRLSSWGIGLDCCQWHGITCDFNSRKVTKIDLRNSFGFNRFHDANFSDWAYHKISVQESRNSCLGGEVSSHLLQLKHLNYLDLSLNNFEGASIPYFFGMLKNLRYLNLSSTNFGGEIPHHLGNLSRLNYLDLSGSDRYFYQTTAYLRAESLHWLSGLSSLMYLNLRQVNLSNVGADWMHTVNSLYSLEELYLGGCGISNFDTSIRLVNLTSLRVFDLSINRLNSSISLWLSNLTSLVVLDLRYNEFQGTTIPLSYKKLKNLQYLDLSWNNIGIGGHIPSFLRNLCELRFLNLAGNKFSKLDEFFGSYSNCSHNHLESLFLNSNELVGEMPNSLGAFKNLQHLDLSQNNLWGSLPNSISNLSLLQFLDVSRNLLNGTIPLSFGQLSELISFRSILNSWEGVITEALLMNLTKLEELVLIADRNQALVFDVSYDWTPPFRLKYLSMRNCFIGHQFPIWLRVQTQLTHVTLSNAGIYGTLLKEWISNISSQITHLDLSNNLLNGTLTSWISTSEKEDSLLLRYDNLISLNLENNSFSGPLPSNIGDLMPCLIVLHLSENYLNGTIPSSIQNMSFLQIFSLSNNQLTGELLDYRNESKSLCVIDVTNNNLSGEIPSSIGLLTSLTILMLSNNSLHGEIPKSLKNCPIRSIDLSENRLYGNLPASISNMISLVNLRSNFFSGTIPRQWCNLPLLRVLDLSNNNLSGAIPSCVYKWTAFIHDDLGRNLNGYSISRTEFNSSGSYSEKTMLVIKGREFEYDTILKFVLTIDLSRNRLSGEIPSEITKLIHLGALNLSYNDLVGSIPKNIGEMQLLQTLDLSCNYFSGWIPDSLASLTFLAHLNLSFNNLTGRIPKSTQLQTLDDPSIYEGNPSLCGSPLQIKCPGDENADITLPVLRRNGKTNENGSEMFCFFISMAIGFPVGLNILFFTILIKESWRASYFGFIDRVNYNILDNICVLATCIRRIRWS